MNAGDTVKYSKPATREESAYRFRVIESHDGRVTMACLNLPGWQVIQPVETVDRSEVQLCEVQA